MRLLRLLGTALCLACLVPGCGGGDDSAPDAGARGTLISAEPIGSYPAILLRQLLALYDEPVALVPRNEVKAYRVIYITEDATGARVEASGAIFLPVGKNNLPVISLQHVIQTDREAVASVNPLTYGPDALLAASVGYAACAPDYIGLGKAATGIHPYLHARCSANAVMDLLRACRTFCSNEGVVLNDQLFLAGYSEGAYVTLAAQRAMESEAPAEFRVTASAGLSGPYDLESAAAAILGNPGAYAAYFAYMLVAYDNIYGWNQLDHMFREPYAGQVAGLFDGSHPIEEVENVLDGTIADVITPEFRAGYAAGTEANIIQALRENTLLGWQPVAPIRLYHGTADRLAPFQNAVSTANSLGSQPGASVTLYPVQGAGHERAIVTSLDATFQWFESMRR